MHLKNKLERRSKQGNLRKLSITSSLIDFASNDYLGLSRSAHLIKAVFQEWKEHLHSLNGLGSTGSRLLTGNSLYAEDLEDKIAQFHGYESGLLFSCGYMANVGLLSSIASEEDVIFFDAGVHASTRDGIRLSRAHAFPFRHNDLTHLENRLKHCSFQGDCFVCIESIYSTDGSCAPLVEICHLLQKYEAFLIVDEAHAVGVLGPKGRGLIAEHNLMHHVFAQITTFGKALGTYGAIILGGKILKEALLNFATSSIYTTALPLQILAAIKCSYDLFPQWEKERQHLRNLVQLFVNADSNCATTHIQSIVIKGNEPTKEAARKLASLGFDVRPLLSPTIQKGQEALRVCLHAFNTEEEVNNLISHIRTL